MGLCRMPVAFQSPCRALAPQPPLASLSARPRRAGGWDVVTVQLVGNRARRLAVGVQTIDPADDFRFSRVDLDLPRAALARGGRAARE
jgi:hypothetical protein